jgi:hypothetical protein
LTPQPTASATSSDKDVLLALLALQSSYHNHKETMAYSIFGLEGAFFIGLFVLGNWPPDLIKVPTQLLSLLFVLVWILFHLALRFQLRNRRLAAIQVAACLDALMQTRPEIYRRSNKRTRLNLPIESLIDACLVPVRGVLRDADVKNLEPADGDIIQPQTLSSLRFHQFVHRRIASESFTRYSFPIEMIASVGSIFLLVVALFRVSGAGS